MQFREFIITSALAALASAQSNPIIYPDASAPLVAGEATEITWTPTTEGKLELLLKKGPSDNLEDVMTITAESTNTGSYVWDVPADLPAGENYAIAIKGVDDYVNYTPLIAIESEVDAPTYGDDDTPSASAPSAYPSATKTEEKPKTKAPIPTLNPITPPGYLNSTNPKPHHNGTHNATVSSTKASGNSTVTTKIVSSSKTAPTPTETQSEPEEDKEEEDDESAASTLGRSVGMVVCALVGAAVYLA